ncbi:M42 family peptidase [Vagococcus jeotgali]|uniref:M42 family peptidase n=1 Tax=Vagococcus jeotgali TaxID=3109030 RepID=UPI002DDBA7B6|nr:M42 family peptidase [Vagococcus sp. B2T-5]
MIDIKQILNELTAVQAISGDEKNLTRLLKTKMTPLVDEFVYDNLGSIYGIKKSNTSNAPKVMLTGFLDESGFVVKEIKDNGLIKALVIGDIKADNIVGSKVYIQKETQAIDGIILHSPFEKLKGEVIIDFGFSSKDEAISFDVDYGDSISFCVTGYTSINQKQFFGKAIRRSYGSLQLLNVLSELKDTDLPFDLYVGGTVLNQVGNRGAQTATNLVKPDLAITFDVLPASKKVSDSSEVQGKLGEGALITYYDRSILPNRSLTKLMTSTCHEKGINTQPYFSMQSSDAGWIHKLRIGTPTLLINVAGTNLDYSLNGVHIKDIEDALNATVSIIEKLTTMDIHSFKEENR